MTNFIYLIYSRLPRYIEQVYIICDNLDSGQNYIRLNRLYCAQYAEEYELVYLMCPTA